MRIREADIDAERSALIDFLTRNLSGHGGARHFDWLYTSSPGGRARVWVGEDDRRQRIIGAAAAFPRPVIVCGEPTVCWNLGDFAIDKEHRSLGPAIRLQRACLAEVFRGGVAFAYDHPSCNMMAIYRRLGVDATGQVVRFARPLRLDDKIKFLSGDSVVSRGALAVGNLLLSLRGRGGSAPRDFRVRPLEARFDQRFTDLDARVGSEFTVRGRRDADYLNWRYLDNPLDRFETLMLEHEDRLVGYAVISRREKDAVVVDLFGERRDEVINGLLAAVIESAREGGVHTLSVPALENSLLAPVLERWGFVAREGSPMVVTAPAEGKWRSVVTDGSEWLLTHGDRDV